MMTTIYVGALGSRATLGVVYAMHPDDRPANGGALATQTPSVFNIMRRDGATSHTRSSVNYVEDDDDGE